MDALAQLLTTVATRDEALALAHDVVDARAAACVQIVGPMTSVYRWEDAVHEESELLLLMKVPAARAEALLELVRRRHPYETPEIALHRSDLVDERYLGWAEEVTSGQESATPSANE